MSLPGSHIAINGINYHVSDQGESEKVVLLLHGMPDTSSLWRHQVPALLTAGYRVIAPDMLGYGKTDKPADPARYSGELVLADIVALLETLNIDKMDLVGHDWGAFLSWELVTHFPQLFRKHVTVSVGHLGVFFSDFSVDNLKQNWYMYLNSLDNAAELYSLNDGEFFISGIVPTHPEPEEVRARLKDPVAMRANVNWDRGNQLADFYMAHLQGELSTEKCTVPTMGIWSTGDTYLKEEHMTQSEEFVSAEWRYERIEGGSHWIMLDRPDEVTKLLLDWFVD